MTLMSSKYSCQKITSKSIQFVQAIVRKMWDIRLVPKCHNRISEVEKSTRSLSRFCYNALTNLISQYTILNSLTSK
jgi:hypothetical protein